MDLALNNLQKLICHKLQAKKQTNKLNYKLWMSLDLKKENSDMLHKLSGMQTAQEI